MNLFRSEEHARRWSGFNAEHAAGLLTLAQLAGIMSTALMRERLNGHYVSSAAGYRREFLDRVREVTGADPFWNPAAR
ncbi:MAG TPA: hypothetical protein VGL09_02925 [Methylomirabilota bacterium]|jgi:hypothetical protein